MFAAAEESAAAGLVGADARRYGEAAGVEEGFGGGGEIEESLLAEDGGPDGLIAFELVAIERIVPTGLGVQVLAFLRIAAVVGLLEGPAIGNQVEDVADWGELVGSEFGDVVRIGVQAVTKGVIAE